MYVCMQRYCSQSGSHERNKKIKSNLYSLGAAREKLPSRSISTQEFLSNGVDSLQNFTTSFTVGVFFSFSFQQQMLFFCQNHP
jgi:hypothetical protein